jgi:multiple sugar transport system permease protein
MCNKKKGALQEALAAYLFLSPNILGFITITMFPIFASLVLSFMDWSVLKRPKWIGLNNFVNLFNGTDRYFFKIVWNTIYFTIGVVPIGIIIAIVIAVLLNQKIYGRTIFRMMIFMPVVASTIASALMWQWLFAKDIGIIAYGLRMFGITAPAFLTDVYWAMPAVIIYSVWKNLGYNVVLLLAGLQSIPNTYSEAAYIDGANGIQIFRKITLPLLTPTIFFVLIMTIISSFQVFDQTYVLTKGGPAYATTTIVYYLYLNGFIWLKMGYASAIAWVLFVIIMGLTVFQWNLQRKWVNYDYD